MRPNGMLSPSTSVVLNRCALISSLINRAAGFAVANGSVPSIGIVITRPARRSLIGTDRIWVSSSLALGNGGVNAGEKLHRRAGIKLHHGWMPDGLPREASFCLLAVDVGEGWVGVGVARMAVR